MAKTYSIKRVPLLTVGEDWNLRSGKKTFQPEDLASAVEAFDDPAIQEAVIKLGHDEDSPIYAAFKGATPAFGRIANPEFDRSDMTLYGDLVGLPKWLKDSAPTFFPRRSIEGGFNHTSETGKQHRFVLSAVALLGAQYPAITSLDALELAVDADSIDQFEMIAASGADETPLERGPEMSWFNKRPEEKVQASIAVEDVRRAWRDHAQATNKAQWVRETYVDPPMLITFNNEEKKAYQVDYLVNAEGISFGEPVEVIPAGYVKSDEVTASMAKPEVVYSGMEETAPSKLTSNEVPSNQELSMTPENLKALGLVEGASQADIDAAFAAMVAKANATVQNADGDEVQGDPPVVPETPPGTPPTVVPQLAPQSELDIPEGMALIDAATLEDLKVAASISKELKETARVNEREEVISAGMADGKFGPAQAAEYRELFDEAPVRARKIIEIMASGVVPLKERGIGHEDVVQTEDLSYSSEGLTPSEIARINRLKTVQEA